MHQSHIESLYLRYLLLQVARSLADLLRQNRVDLVTVDAEDHTTTDSTLSIVEELRRDFPTLGTVLQAYLHRTEADCRHFSGSGSRIRLCKGAYKEPAGVAFQKAAEVDASYVRCLKVLMEGDGYPMVASHDPTMIDAALGLATLTERTAADFEFQML